MVGLGTTLQGELFGTPRCQRNHYSAPALLERPSAFASEVVIGLDGCEGLAYVGERRYELWAFLFPRKFLRVRALSTLRKDQCGVRPQERFSMLLSKCVKVRFVPSIFKKGM
ncbi:hypothetical protein FJTKL_11347 [Diaporthe vaccinii]|uniref:Uncharacterized protein n=1 Tax=Diaporthe vaccinii TaxID=105482 RepID=A0ABR4EHJ6_9PEZI